MSLEKILSIKFPGTLSSDIKNLVKDVYLRSVDKITFEEYEYVGHKIKTKVNYAMNCSTAWISDLASCYDILYEVLLTRKSTNHLSLKTYNLICAALFYFINPLDLIPDHTPEVGYLDDLLVLLTCIKSIDNKDLNSIFEIAKQYEVK